MRRIRNYHELYNIIIKSFYLGEYHKGDRFPTQLELAQTYKVAANSVKKVFRLLLEDGFITTNRSFGTVVSFDFDNPEHVAKVPLFFPTAKDEVDTLLIPSHFAAAVVHHGVKMASYAQRAEYVKCIDLTLVSPQGIEQLMLSRSEPLHLICSSFNNSYISDFADFLRYDYIFVNNQVLTCAASQVYLSKIIRSFYTTLRRLIVEECLEPIYELCMRHLEELYRVPGLFVYSIIERNGSVFTQQALYTQLMHRLFLSIVAGNLRKGDMLPSEHSLAIRYGVSIITVRRAMSVLKEIGLVDGERFVGTQMIEDWDSPALQEWLAGFINTQKKMISDSIFVECIIGRIVCRYVESVIDDTIVGEMQQTLDSQWQGYQSYHAPLFMAEVFAAPIVSRIDSQLLTEFFYHAHNDLTKFLAIRLLQMSEGFDETETVYRYALDAIEALGRGDYPLFVSQVIAAVTLNLQLLQSALDSTVYRCLDLDNQEL